MSDRERRDENGDSNCTGEVGSKRKCAYSMEDLDSAVVKFIKQRPYKWIIKLIPSLGKKCIGCVLLSF